MRRFLDILRRVTAGQGAQPAATAVQLDDLAVTFDDTPVTFE